MAAPEAWLRGPVDGVPGILQPAAHALVQVLDDIPPIVTAATVDQLWARPGGSASIGYHVWHMAGALDRLFTYARGEALTPAQKTAFVEEQRIDEARPTAGALLTLGTQAIDAALAQLRATDPARVLDAREVGRAKLPSSVLGLLFHAAEHSTRHAGQVITIAKVLGVSAP